VSRRFRRGAAPTCAQLTDENGQPITFATPGAPTAEERRRYAQAVQRATTPPPLTREQQAAQKAATLRRRELFPHFYNDRKA
jgi:hypothetical protein